MMQRHVSFRMQEQSHNLRISTLARDLKKRWVHCNLLVEISNYQMVRSQRRETQSIRLRTCRKELMATAGPVRVCAMSWQQPYKCSMVFKGQHIMIVLCNQGTLSLILARKLHSHLNDMQTNSTCCTGPASHLKRISWECFLVLLNPLSPLFFTPVASVCKTYLYPPCFFFFFSESSLETDNTIIICQKRSQAEIDEMCPDSYSYCGLREMD